MKTSVAIIRLPALILACFLNFLIYTGCGTKPVYEQPSYSFKSAGRKWSDEQQSREETLKYVKKELCGTYYVGGKSNAPCCITNIDGALFAINEKKETARLVVTPELRILVEAWHFSGNPTQGALI